MYTPNLSEFPDFSLERLLVTCFGHTPSARLKTCILIDLPDLSLMVGHRFLSENGFEVQKCAHDVFLKLLKEGVSERMGYSSTDFFAFKTTGGSNLDPEDELIDSEGNSLTFTEDLPEIRLDLGHHRFLSYRTFDRHGERTRFSWRHSSWRQRCHS